MKTKTNKPNDTAINTASSTAQSAVSTQPAGSTPPNTLTLTEVQPEISAEQVKDAETYLMQAANEETSILKVGLGLASRMVFRNHKILLAKRKVGAGGRDQKATDEFYSLARAHGFKSKRTIQRHMQFAELLIEHDLVPDELQVKIRKAEALGDELVAEITASVGTASGTALMRQVGMLEKIEDDIEGKEPSLKVKLDSAVLRMKSSIKSMADMVDAVFLSGDKALMQQFRSALDELNVELVQQAQKYDQLYLKGQQMLAVAQQETDKAALHVSTVKSQMDVTQKEIAALKAQREAQAPEPALV